MVLCPLWQRRLPHASFERSCCIGIYFHILIIIRNRDDRLLKRLVATPPWTVLRLRKSSRKRISSLLLRLSFVFRIRLPLWFLRQGTARPSSDVDMSTSSSLPLISKSGRLAAPIDLGKAFGKKVDFSVI